MPMSHRELQLATRNAWREASRSAADRPGEPPGPGDVFVLPETSHLAVEWAVIDRDPASQRLFAVPADTCTLVGSGDFQVPETSARAPLCLRCAFGLWLPAATFKSELRSATLSREELRGARQVWTSIGPESTEAASGQDSDTDLEYQEWLEEGPARARALIRERAQAITAATAGDPSPQPPSREMPAARLHRRLLGDRRWPLAAIAASLLLVAGGVWVGWHEVESRRLAAANRELGRPAAEPVANVLIAGLYRVRGGQKILLPAEVEALVLAIGDPDLEPTPSYRLELSSEETGQTIWRHDGLRLLEASGQLTVGLPRSLLAAGRYRVLVSALDADGDARPVADYRIEIEAQEP